MCMYIYIYINISNVQLNYLVLTYYHEIIIGLWQEWASLIAQLVKNQIAEVHIKGRVSVSPNSCLFPYTEKLLNSLTWDFWFSFLNGSLLTFKLPDLLLQKLLYILVHRPAPPHTRTPTPSQPLLFQNSFLVLSEMLCPGLEVPSMSTKENLTLNS